MKLKLCLEIGSDCYLNTVDEAVCNIHFHCLSIFNYDAINRELDELDEEYLLSGLTGDNLIVDALSKIENNSKEK